MMKVLVVDDEEVIRRLFRQALEAQGYAVVTADNGLEAIGCAVVEEPDAILMDLEMPRLGGAEATKVLRQLPATANIPVIVLTGASTVENVMKLRAAGAVDFMTKEGVNIALLKQKLLQAIEARGRQSP